MASPMTIMMATPTAKIALTFDGQNAVQTRLADKALEILSLNTNIDAMSVGAATGLFPEEETVKPLTFDYSGPAIPTYWPNKIDAIKAVREYTNLGLKEAKDLLDWLVPLGGNIPAHGLTRERCIDHILDYVSKQDSRFTLVNAKATLDAAIKSQTLVTPPSPRLPTIHVEKDMTTRLYRAYFEGDFDNYRAASEKATAIGLLILSRRLTHNLVDHSVGL